MEQRYGVAYNPEDKQCEIIVTAGVSEALDLAIRATVDPQDEVIVPEPSYVSYAPCVVFAGDAAHHRDAQDDFALSARQVAAAVTPRTKGIILGYPNNPTGAALSRRARGRASASPWSTTSCSTRTRSTPAWPTTARDHTFPPSPGPASARSSSTASPRATP